jgi:uncharacterized RDD family membrane protein YckC
MQLPQFERWHLGSASGIQAVTREAGVVYEGFGRRLLAGLADLILALVLVATVVLVRLASEQGPPLASAVLDSISGLWVVAPWLLAMLVLVQSLFWTVLAGTPGMLLLGCQVVRADSGGHLTFFRSLLRCIALWIGMSCLGVGVLWSIWDPRRQGLHDKLAGSVVVREDESLLALDELLRGVN